MDENKIIEELKWYFTKINNPVLKFINHNTSDTEIVVKGTPKEWENLLMNLTRIKK